MLQFVHHNVAKLLLLCKRAHTDIQTAMAFLTTRVKSPDINDYKKLGQVMHYLHDVADMPLTLEADSLRIMKWWVDGAFPVHNDMKSHMGGVLSLGKGVIYGTSMYPKLNTKSSTEAELIEGDDAMPQILWTRYFMEDRVTPLMTQSSTRITRARCCLRRIDMDPPATAPITSASGTSL